MVGFIKGDIITFCDEDYEVLENYGIRGTVKEVGEKGEIVRNFYWNYQGVECELKSQKCNEEGI